MTTSTTPSIAAGVASKSPVPKGFSGATTDSLQTPYIHAILYGETDRRKTTTAAKFRGPEHTFILLTRSPEQLIPIQSGNYHYARVQDAAALTWALTNPEQAADAAGFPEWKNDPERTLVIDDMTEGMNFIVDSNETDDEGRERKNGMQIYGASNDDLRAVLTSLKRRKMHLLVITLAKVALSSIANEEEITLDVPMGALKILKAEFEYGFYLTENGKMMTRPSLLTFKKKDERGREVSGIRKIFAKSKLAEELMKRQPPVLAAEEPLDLAAVWEKIVSAGRGGK